MIQKATVRVGDMIGNPEYPKAHFRLGMVIEQIPSDFDMKLEEDLLHNEHSPSKTHMMRNRMEYPEYGDFMVLTNSGKQEWFTFDYVYLRCELLNREDKED